jgi:hypothetical protein
MGSVWSLWSKPLQAHRSRWKSELYHLFSMIVSVENARKHYPHTALYTDDDGARLLVDALGLPFGYVSTSLNDLAGHNFVILCRRKATEAQAQMAEMMEKLKLENIKKWVLKPPA